MFHHIKKTTLAVALLTFIAVSAGQSKSADASDLAAMATYATPYNGQVWVWGHIFNADYVYKNFSLENRRAALYLYYPIKKIWVPVFDVPLPDMPPRTSYYPNKLVQVPLSFENPIPVLFVTGNDSNDSNNLSTDAYWF